MKLQEKILHKKEGLYRYVYTRVICKGVYAKGYMSQKGYMQKGYMQKGYMQKGLWNNVPVFKIGVVA